MRRECKITCVSNPYLRFEVTSQFFFFKIEQRDDQTMTRKEINPDVVKLAESILNIYPLDSVGNKQKVLKDLFCPLFGKMLQG